MHSTTLIRVLSVELYTTKRGAVAGIYSRKAIDGAYETEVKQ